MERLHIALIIINVGLLIGVFALWSQVPEINYSCQADSDCIIVDGHSCCGYYPVCANKNSRPNPGFVDFMCIFSFDGSVCGFMGINRCECVENECIGKFVRG